MGNKMSTDEKYDNMYSITSIRVWLRLRYLRCTVIDIINKNIGYEWMSMANTWITVSMTILKMMMKMIKTTTRYWKMQPLTAKIIFQLKKSKTGTVCGW